MSSVLNKKLREFANDAASRERFEKAVLSAPFEILLWPERAPAGFARAYRLEYRGHRIPYPLAKPLDRLHWVGRKIEHLMRHSAEAYHPALVFLQLSLFEAEHNPPTKVAPKKKRGRAKVRKQSKTEKLKPAEAIGAEIGRLKRKLKVSPAVRRARGATAVLSAVLKEMAGMTSAYYLEQEKRRSQEIELEMYHKNQARSSDERGELRRLREENGRLTVQLRREAMRGDALETELARIADRVLSSSPPQESGLLAELRALRKEYSLLSTRNDELTHRNLLLTKQVRDLRESRLARQLDQMRGRINEALRTRVGDEAGLLRVLEEEIREIQRARVYLGRALHDIGMLYERTGDRERAVVELRAARQLGVEDLESSRILNGAAARS